LSFSAWGMLRKRWLPERTGYGLDRKLRHCDLVKEISQTRDRIAMVGHCDPE